MIITQYVPSERGCDLSKLPLSSRAYILFGGERVLQHLQQRIRVDATGARLAVRSHTVVEQTEGPMAVFQSTQIVAPRTPFPSSPVYPLSFSLSLTHTHTRTLSLSRAPPPTTTASAADFPFYHLRGVASRLGMSARTMRRPGEFVSVMYAMWVLNTIIIASVMSCARETLGGSDWLADEDDTDPALENSLEGTVRNNPELLNSIEETLRSNPELLNSTHTGHALDGTVTVNGTTYSFGKSGSNMILTPEHPLVQVTPESLRELAEAPNGASYHQYYNIHLVCFLY